MSSRRRPAPWAQPSPPSTNLQLGLQHRTCCPAFTPRRRSCPSAPSTPTRAPPPTCRPGRRPGTPPPAGRRAPGTPAQARGTSPIRPTRRQTAGRLKAAGRRCWRPWGFGTWSTGGAWAAAWRDGGGCVGGAGRLGLLVRKGLIHPPAPCCATVRPTRTVATPCSIHLQAHMHEFLLASSLFVLKHPYLGWPPPRTCHA